MGITCWLVCKALNGKDRKKLIEAVIAWINHGSKSQEQLGEPPPQIPASLKLAFDCKMWDTLPKSGGYLEQEYRMMREMKIAYNVYNAVTKARNSQGAQIHNLTFEERRILKPLVKEGLI